MELLESNVEKLTGYPSGLDELINENQAQKIKSVIDKLTHAKKQSDIETVIKMLRAMVI